MPEISPNLALPYIQPAQAQKHVTHNEAIRLLDLITQLTVKSDSLATPPVELAAGARYLVAAGATGAWIGHAGEIAYLQDATWQFLPPVKGWVAWVVDAARFVVFDGTVWIVPAAPLPSSVDKLGINATADNVNRLSVSAAATLLNHAGSGHQIKVNKATTADTASLLFQTGFSGRAEMGLGGDDNFSIKVSADGSTFQSALVADASTGRVALTKPLIMTALAAAPTPPVAGTMALFARDRAGAAWPEVMRSSGRSFPLQPHFGKNRIAFWSPSTGTTVTTSGMPRTSTGTVATPNLTPINLANSMRRWRVTSAAAAGSASDERSAGWVCWRGNGAGLGGWTYVNRMSTVTLQPTGSGFFGLYGSNTTLPGTLTLSGVTACVGFGFDRGTHNNWQVVTSSGGTPTLTDLGASFSVGPATNVLTMYIFAAPNSASVWVRLVEETSGAAVEVEITANLPPTTQFLSPRNFLSNGTTAAAVAFDCSGVYIETDF